DGADHRVPELMATLARQFGLTEEDLADMVPSGTQGRFENRVRWATFYLRRAGFLKNTAHGQFRITPLGLEALAKHPVPLAARAGWPAGWAGPGGPPARRSRPSRPGRAAG